MIFFTFQPSDYGSMSQSCQSVVPPLNLDYEEDDCDVNSHMLEDELRRDVSLGYLGIGSRFSEISIEERKDRIKNLVSEIYNTCPLSEGNPTRRSLNQSIKRYASMDQVSDVESVITLQHKNSPMKQQLNRAPSYGSSINRAASLRKFASSPKLSNPQMQMSARPGTNMMVVGRMSQASSMINIKAKKNSLEEHVNKHLPLRKNQSAPMQPAQKLSTASSRCESNNFSFFKLLVPPCMTQLMIIESFFQQLHQAFSRKKSTRKTIKTIYTAMKKTNQRGLALSKMTTLIP